MSGTDDPSDPGIKLIQIVYFLFALVMPLLLNLVAWVLWAYPLTLRRQHQLFVACEILTAWNGLEVFVSSILAALLEIETFAEVRLCLVYATHITTPPHPVFCSVHHWL